MPRTITKTYTCPCCKYQYIERVTIETRNNPESSRITLNEVINTEILSGDEFFKSYDVGDDYEAIILLACPKCGVMLLPKCVRKVEEKEE